MPPAAPFWRRFLAFFYDSILLIAIWIVATWGFLVFEFALSSKLPKFIFQIYLFAIAGFYFVFCWQKTGQTLGSKAWKLKLLTSDLDVIPTKTCLVRYLLATAGAGLFGVNWFWCLFDRNRQSLVDRLLKTKLISVKTL